MGNKSNADAVKDYQKKLDDIKIRVPRGNVPLYDENKKRQDGIYKSEIKKYADSQGLSLNKLFLRAIQLDAKEHNYTLNFPKGVKEMKDDDNND